MKIIKKILSILSSVCLAGVALTDSLYFAIALLVFASMTIGVFLGEIKFKCDFATSKGKKNALCTFKDITEKDMDMLFLEEIVSNQEFIDIFLSEIDMMGAKVIEIEHSKTHPEYGESDMTIIVEFHNKRYGLLIEDKIDAIAMPEQYERYVKRGNYGVEKSEFEDYFVFIVAPQKYLDENAESKKYPNMISYEKCLEYFEKKQDARSQFKATQIKFAIDCQKKGYQVIENKAVTDFWENYINYQETHFSSLRLISKRGPKGANATWPQYRISLGEIIPGACIYHKSGQGYVDLNIPKAAKYVNELKKYLETVVGNLDENELLVESTKGAAVIRIKVPSIDFKEKFNKYSDVIDECFLAIKKMYEIEEKLDGNAIKEIIG